MKIQAPHIIMLTAGICFVIGLNIHLHITWILEESIFTYFNSFQFLSIFLDFEAVEKCICFNHLQRTWEFFYLKIAIPAKCTLFYNFKIPGKLYFRKTIILSESIFPYAFYRIRQTQNLCIKAIAKGVIANIGDPLFENDSLNFRLYIINWIFSIH